MYPPGCGLNGQKAQIRPAKNAWVKSVGIARFGFLQIICFSWTPSDKRIKALKQSEVSFNKRDNCSHCTQYITAKVTHWVHPNQCLPVLGVAHVNQAVKFSWTDAVCNELNVCQSIIGTSLLCAQDHSTEVGVHNVGTKTLKLGYQLRATNIQKFKKMTNLHSLYFKNGQKYAK